MKLRIDRVKPGMFLTKSVYLNGNSMPLIVIKDGETKELTETEIFFLKNKGIKNLYVNFELPKVGSVTEETEELAEEILFANDYGNIVKVAELLTDDILNNTPYSYDLTSYFTQNEDLYNHSVHTASFALAIIKSMNDDEGISFTADINDYLEISKACLLHDIGKNIDENDLKKFQNEIVRRDKFNSSYFPEADLNCFNEIKPESYPIYSWSKIAGEDTISSLVKTSVLIQNENNEKTGPLHFNIGQLTIKNKKAALFAKMINTCSYFDDLLYHVPTSEVVEKIKQDVSDRKVDPLTGTLLLRYIPIYPVGTKVILSNGLDAVVIRTNPNYPDRPVISVMINGVATEFDLLTNNNVTITEINTRGLDFLKYGKQK